jgi:hypothetical protein
MQRQVNGVGLFKDEPGFCCEYLMNVTCLQWQGGILWDLNHVLEEFEA